MVATCQLIRQAKLNNIGNWAIGNGSNAGPTTSFAIRFSRMRYNAIRLIWF
jgi:hypothetical protein